MSGVGGFRGEEESMDWLVDKDIYCVRCEFFSLFYENIILIWVPRYLGMVQVAKWNDGLARHDMILIILNFFLFARNGRRPCHSYLFR